MTRGIKERPSGVVGPGVVSRAVLDPASRTNASSPSYAYADEEHITCVVGNVAITYSMAPPSPRLLMNWADLMDRLEAPILVLTVIESGVRAPDSAAKAAIRQTVTRHESRIAGFAYVVEGEGFGAAAVRSAISLISLAARYRFPQTVGASAAEVVPWLIEKLPPAKRTLNDPRAIVQAVDAMRAELRQKSTAR